MLLKPVNMGDQNVLASKPEVYTTVTFGRLFF